VLGDDVDVTSLPDPHDVLLVEPRDFGATRVAQDVVSDPGVLRERVVFKRERLRLDVLEVQSAVGPPQG
jgi:hypothetical protein